MKRRFFTLLAVPALVLGFAFSSAGADEAQAYPIVSMYTMCAWASYNQEQGTYYDIPELYNYYHDLGQKMGCWSA
jgi:hypothetical protein